MAGEGKPSFPLNLSTTKYVMGAEASSLVKLRSFVILALFLKATALFSFNINSTKAWLMISPSHSGPA